MHLAFFVPPAPGHVNPALPLVAELVRRGHRVGFATGASMVPAVRAAGAEPVPLPSEIPDRPLSGTAFTAGDLAAMLEGVLANARADLPVMLEHFGAERPDVVCFDAINPFGRVVADSLGVPAAALVPNLTGHDDAPLSETFMPEAFDFGDARLLAARRAMTDFAAEHGVGALPDPMSEVMAPLNLVFVPRRFQPGGEAFDDRFHFVGPSPRPEDASRWRPRRPDAPLVFVSLGTVFNERPDFFRACAEAFEGTPWQVAMSVGSHLEVSTLGTLPENVEVRPHFPQLAVLREADVFVTHCGMGSTMEALYHEVPMVAAPQVPEQRRNARRVAELGLGRLLEEPDAASIRAAVESVADDARIGEALSRMREAIEESGGAAAGADALERYVDEAKTA
ncbi:MGT family glycosyltransferase [Saccharopolyspora erythraea NRRL 2338]|uniref:Antibiotic resistance macrolide glycosyltransferase n=2 Tax=Saccharopolyspora erythraea TaxID=1836 RepID=A4FAX1_SACEN|nr:macrolide family glycosyltransferase [Saccharopolyspora erythraea]EQD87586.1 antibiotic resistance macrolide glycosyltransferase [Saccharopolyspora erythraea D]PFG94978.1 MGT family glycosyltransferase [Saccharopolyspora erythraea NRRL 2338]QRK91668.1 glycosyl transferase [Saccharopolyspora erythraea]CAM01196.1 antibiotic resistance macrolide glycosyltransferase [Saccharopolyspora erythraea NRRL 2338]